MHNTVFFSDYNSIAIKSTPKSNDYLDIKHT